MMTLAYLWRERSRHPYGSFAWLKSWAKRIYNAGELLRICWKQYRLSSQGAQIGALAVVDAQILGRAGHLSVGPETSIGRATMLLQVSVQIGARVTINDGVTILTASHDLNDPAWRVFTRSVQIDDYAWIAQNATILPGVHIGRGAVVGAGAVVSKDVKPYAVVVGNPAQPNSAARTQDLDYSPVAFLAPYEAWLERPTHSVQQQAKEIVHEA